MSVATLNPAIAALAARKRPQRRNITLRMPTSFARYIKAFAGAEGISMNEWMVARLECCVKEDAR
jgi:predicted HicB family RNase H-like nuclease